MIAWLIWTAPIVLAIAVAARRAPPGPWLDRTLHVFGVGAIDCRRAAITALVIIAVIGLGTDAILGYATALGPPWRQLDGLAIGAVAALTTLLLAGWLNPESIEPAEIEPEAIEPEAIEPEEIEPEEIEPEDTEPVQLAGVIEPEDTEPVEIDAAATSEADEPSAKTTAPPRGGEER